MGSSGSSSGEWLVVVVVSGGSECSKWLVVGG